jgi:hypothetical protein
VPPTFDLRSFQEASRVCQADSSRQKIQYPVRKLADEIPFSMLGQRLLEGGCSLAPVICHAPGNMVSSSGRLDALLRGLASLFSSSLTQTLTCHLEVMLDQMDDLAVGFANFLFQILATRRLPYIFPKSG